MGTEKFKNKTKIILYYSFILANFVLPEVEETHFSEVLYVEKGPAEAETIINGYIAEAKDRGVTPTAGVKTFKNRCTTKRQVGGDKNTKGF